MTDDEVQAKREDQAEQAWVAEGASREESKAMSETPKPVPAPNVPTRGPMTLHPFDGLRKAVAYGLGFCVLIFLSILTSPFFALRPTLSTVLTAFLVCRLTEHGWLGALAGGVVGSLMVPSVPVENPYRKLWTNEFGKDTTGCILGMGNLSWYTFIGALTAWATAFFG